MKIKTDEEVKKIAKEFGEYMFNGYSGGESGLRCDLCDGKYSGTAAIRQLCPECKFLDIALTLIHERDATIRERIEEVCNEQTMERIWNLDGGTIAKYLQPDYDPHCMPYRPGSKEEYEKMLSKGECEMYQVGFVRGESRGAQKLKGLLLSLLPVENKQKG